MNCCGHRLSKDKPCSKRPVVLAVLKRPKRATQEAMPLCKKCLELFVMHPDYSKYDLWKRMGQYERPNEVVVTCVRDGKDKVWLFPDGTRKRSVVVGAGVTALADYYSCGDKFPVRPRRR